MSKTTAKKADVKKRKAESPARDADSAKVLKKSKGKQTPKLDLPVRTLHSKSRQLLKLITRIIP